MKLSRRKFVKAGIIAAACAPLLPVRRALAQEAGTNDVQEQSSSIVQQLGYYNESSFEPYLNTRFRVYLSPSNTRSLELTNVSNYPTSLSQLSSLSASPNDDCFSLLFQIPPGKPFTQDTYLIKHDALGTFYMFVVPIGAHSKQHPDYYEAIIYRHQQDFVGQEPTLIVNAPRDGAVGKAQTGQSQQLIYGGGALVMQPSNSSSNSQDAKPDEKVESDVYRFRQAEIAPPAPAEQTNVAPPPKKKVFPMTLAQSPAINGLRLGMTPSEVLALFPGSKQDEEVRRELSRPPTRFGVSSFIIRPQKYSTKTKFDRITQIIFTLFDGRVSTLYVGYDSPVFEHVDEFVTDFNKGRKLPAADDWEAYVGLDTQLKTLDCREFEINLFAGGKNVQINYAQVRDLVALQKYKERRVRMKAEG
ncbi:MAG TPA: hypothetical protein VKB86_10060 [Pyrinomonadaceae bacterium]|nr:hypothetical protein [Pyrinomonadaceae bacterium]